MTQIEDIITIDGPSGVGKSAVAKALALSLGYRYLDTGAMYRAVTLGALRSSLDLDSPDEKVFEEFLKRLCFSLDEEGRVLLDSEPVDNHIREDSVTQAVSSVSALKTVRSFLVRLQRRFGKGGRLVAEGRDLGTVVFPSAAHKFYLDASRSERARRRALQNRTSGQNTSTSVEEVLADQRRRDQMDSERSESPLIVAEDMVVLDTTKMNLDVVIETILNRIRKTGH